MREIGSRTDREEQQKASAIAKLTFIGVQEKPILTVVFFTANCLLPTPSRNHIDNGENDTDLISRFSPCQVLSKAFYANDQLPRVNYFSVSSSEMHDILQVTAPFLLRAEQHSRYDVLSFTLIRCEPTGDIAHEYIIAYDEVREFYPLLLSGLSEQNHIARKTLERQFREIIG